MKMIYLSCVILYTSFMISVMNGNPTQDRSKNMDEPLAQYITFVSKPNVNVRINRNPHYNKNHVKLPDTTAIDPTPNLKRKLMEIEDEEFQTQHMNQNGRRKVHVLNNSIESVGQTTTEKHCNLFEDEMIEQKSDIFKKEIEVNNGTVAPEGRGFIDTLMKENRNNVSEIYMEEILRNIDPIDAERIEKIIANSKIDHKSPRFPNGRKDDLSLEEAELDQNRIVGGNEVSAGEYPYHAAYGDHCGAAIIGPKWLITAAHCGVRDSARVGSKYYKAGRELKIKKRFIHPIWKSKPSKEHSFDYDFQLIELKDELQFNENIQPVKIAELKDYVVGKNVSVTGWGSIYEDGPYSKILKRVDLPIAEKSACQNIDFPYFRGTLTGRMFCAGFKDEKYDACQGDSGGPAVSDHKLLGLVSFGYGCATPKGLGVYSSVAVVRDWIARTTGMKL